MNKNKSKHRMRSFTPEQLGLKRVTYGNHTYIDVTPFWIDSKETQRIWNIINGELPFCDTQEGETDI